VLQLGRVCQQAAKAGFTHTINASSIPNHKIRGIN